MKKKSPTEIKKAAEEVLKRTDADVVFATEDAQVFFKREHARAHAKGKSKIYQFPEASTDEDGKTIEHFKQELAEAEEINKALAGQFDEVTDNNKELSEKIIRLENQVQELQDTIAANNATIAKLELELKSKPNNKK